MLRHLATQQALDDLRTPGYYRDQVSRERMTQRISGGRHVQALAVTATPTAEVGAEEWRAQS